MSKKKCFSWSSVLIKELYLLTFCYCVAHAISLLQECFFVAESLTTCSIFHYQQSEVKSLSRVQLFATPWTAAYQASPSMGFSRQEYWSGLPFPSPGDLPDPGIEPGSPALEADALTSEPPGKPKISNKARSN